MRGAARGISWQIIETDTRVATVDSHATNEFPDECVNLCVIRVSRCFVMIRVNIGITNISAERFWNAGKPLPPIQISTNINLVNMTKKNEGCLEVPFVFTIVYNPSIAQISLKGKAHVSGEKSEIERILKEHEEKKPPPQRVMQSISNVVFVESILISRILNIPPSVPLPQIPQLKTGGKRSPEKEYST